MAAVMPTGPDTSGLDDQQLLVFEHVVARYESDWHRDPSIRWQDYLPEDLAVRACLIAELPEIEAEFLRKRAFDDSSCVTIGTAACSTSTDHATRVDAKRDDSREPAFRSITNYCSIQREIRGGLGDVIVIRDQELGRVVVVKQLQKRWQGNSRAERAFQREMRITSRLEHPSIVPVHSVGTTPDGLPFYSMRYVEGQTLQEAIQELHASSRLQMAGLRTLLNHFIQVCRTIAFANARGILHRDLKPANVVIGSYGQTLVLDWGLAKELATHDSSITSKPASMAASHGETISDIETSFELQNEIPTIYGSQAETTLGDIVGTPAYISPEQATGDIKALSIRTDVFGLGAVLYAILFGKPPYAGKDSAETIQLAALAAADFNFNKSSDATVLGLLAICRKAMSKDPRLRYADAQSLADDMETWLAGESIAIQRQPLIQRCVRFASRQRTLASLAALSLVAAIGAIVIGFNSVQAERAQRLIAATQASANAQVTQEVAEYMAKVYRSADPIRFDDPGFAGLEEKNGRSMHKAMLDSGYELIDLKLKQHPKQASELLLSLGASYRGIGEYERATQALSEAHRLRLSLFGSEALQTLQCDYQLGRLAYELGNYEKAEAIQRALLEKLSAALMNSDQPDSRKELELFKADVLSQLGWLLTYRPLISSRPEFTAECIAEPQNALRQVVEIREKYLPHTHRSVGLAYAQLSTALFATRETEAEAVVLAANAMEIFNKSSQESTFGSFLVEYTGAENLRRARKFEEAEVKYLELLEFIRKQVGRRHALVAIHMWNMTGLYRQIGALDKAEQMIVQIREMTKDLQSIRSSHTHLDALREYAEGLTERKRFADAREVYQEIINYAQERSQQHAALINLTQTRMDALPPSNP